MHSKLLLQNQEIMLEQLSKGVPNYLSPCINNRNACVAHVLRNAH